MPKNQKLTKSQQDNIRNTLARRGSAIAARIGKAAMGELVMTNTELKAAQIILAKIVPDLQSTQVENITPDRQDPRTTQQQLHEYIARIDPVELARIQREHGEDSTLQ